MGNLANAHALPLVNRLENSVCVTRVFYHLIVLQRNTMPKVKNVILADSDSSDTKDLTIER